MKIATCFFLLLAFVGMTSAEPVQDGAKSSPAAPSVYLVDDSRGHSITITANDTVIWKGVVEKSDHMPNIHRIGVSPEQQKQCRIRITGDPYQATRDVDWQKGEALIVSFLDDKVSLSQMHEPVGFQ